MNFGLLFAAEPVAETAQVGWLDRLWSSVADMIGSTVATTLLRIAAAILILFVGMKLVKVLVKWIKKSRSFQKLNEDVRSFAGNGILIVLDLLIIVMAVAIVGVPTASIIAVISSCGLAIGLALQGSLSNLAGGIMILAFHPFHVGDFIDNGVHAGTVTEIGLFYTTILTIDNRQIMLPNGTLANNAIVNVTAKDVRRVDIRYPVALTADGDRVKAILLEVAQRNELVLNDPAPEAPLTNGETGARVYELRAWCKTADYWAVSFALRENGMSALKENGIALPHTQVDVHLPKN